MVVVEGRQRDTVSETDREMGGGGVVEVVEGRQRRSLATLGRSECDQFMFHALKLTTSNKSGKNSKPYAVYNECYKTP